uniref:Uncharacterized protein n=1 Tax=mine drainage metagenome TaxID=410659 RepID=E6QMY6_9ZZZZ
MIDGSKAAQRVGAQIGRASDRCVAFLGRLGTVQTTKQILSAPESMRG